MIAGGTKSAANVLALIYISKLCNAQTRSTVFSFYGFFGSVVVLIMNAVGGQLYSREAKVWPFLIGAGVYALAVGLTFALGFKGKLN